MVFNANFNNISVISGSQFFFRGGHDFLGLGFMGSNTTFNNISVISWWSVLLVEDICEKYLKLNL